MSSPSIGRTGRPGLAGAPRKGEERCQFSRVAGEPAPWAPHKMSTQAVRDTTNSTSLRRSQANRLRVVTRLLARADQRVQRAGVWDPTSSFLPAASRSFVRSKSAHVVFAWTSASLSRLKTLHFTESGAARPHGSASICEVKKDSAGDEPTRYMRRRVRPLPFLTTLEES